MIYFIIPLAFFIIFVFSLFYDYGFLCDRNLAIFLMGVAFLITTVLSVAVYTGNQDRTKCFDENKLQHCSDYDLNRMQKIKELKEEI